MANFQTRHCHLLSPRSSSSASSKAPFFRIPTRSSSAISWSREMRQRASAKQRISRHSKLGGGCCTTIVSDSCRTPGSFMTVILQRMIVSGWKLLQTHCLFTCVLCVSGLDEWRWVALVCTARVIGDYQEFSPGQNRFKETMTPSVTRLWISRFLSLGLSEGESVWVWTSHNGGLGRRHQTGDRQHWRWYDIIYPVYFFTNAHKIINSHTEHMNFLHVPAPRQPLKKIDVQIPT